MTFLQRASFAEVRRRVESNQVANKMHSGPWAWLAAADNSDFNLSHSSHPTNWRPATKHERAPSSDTRRKIPAAQLHPVRRGTPPAQSI